MHTLDDHRFRRVREEKDEQQSQRGTTMRDLYLLHLSGDANKHSNRRRMRSAATVATKLGDESEGEHMYVLGGQRTLAEAMRAGATLHARGELVAEAIAVYNQGSVRPAGARRA